MYKILKGFQIAKDTNLHSFFKKANQTNKTIPNILMYLNDTENKEEGKKCPGGDFAHAL